MNMAELGEGEDALLKKAFVEISSKLKSLDDDSSCIRELVNVIFANLDDEERARIMIFHAIVVQTINKKGLTVFDKGNIPSYIS